MLVWGGTLRATIRACKSSRRNHIGRRRRHRSGRRGHPSKEGARRGTARRHHHHVRGGRTPEAVRGRHVRRRHVWRRHHARWRVVGLRHRLELARGRRGHRSRGGRVAGRGRAELLLRLRRQGRMKLLLLTLLLQVLGLGLRLLGRRRWFTKSKFEGRGKLVRLKVIIIHAIQTLEAVLSILQIIIDGTARRRRLVLLLLLLLLLRYRSVGGGRCHKVQSTHIIKNAGCVVRRR
mmetsp:Transcript_13907/g.27015  ORF Transcript_13907/g.27015 Transcript_13907/m.27015 type:complete len:234 (+) Transcript_13907:2311-3012(+)